MASETALVRVQHAAHGLVAMAPDLIALIAVAGVEVEGEDHIAPFKDDHLTTRRVLRHVH